jgi:hypothetical protein
MGCQTSLRENKLTSNKFINDILCLCGDRVFRLDKFSNSIDIIEELLKYYNKDTSYSNYILNKTITLAFDKDSLRVDNEILSNKGDVVRLAIVSDNRCIGILSFTYVKDRVYEISYFITSFYRGNSNISSLLDKVQHIAIKNNINLLAKVNDNNFKSRHLIENHLQLKFICKDKNNISVFGG